MQYRAFPVPSIVSAWRAIPLAGAWRACKRGIVAGAIVLGAASYASLGTLPGTLLEPPESAVRATVLARDGSPLARTYGNRFNHQDLRPLDEIPARLRDALIYSEDRRFFTHSGVDWRARISAVMQNVRAMRSVRGASTISEQVVRMLVPRPRTMWSRWIEGLDAYRLEQRFTKAEILAFYLNQVPYSGNRRGLVQAAREYFGRSLDTLSEKEQLALAVLPRSPSRWDPRRDRPALNRAVMRLAERMMADGMLSATDVESLRDEELLVREPASPLEAPHLVRAARTGAVDGIPRKHAVLTTTIDPALQKGMTALLNARLHSLRNRNVRDGALLIVDHRRDEILAWVNGDGDPTVDREDAIDSVITPRQPGSTLKPFLYALALERGFTTSTLVDDAPLYRPVGFGSHRYMNYSGRFYGPLRMREVLGNSLNLPAVRTVEAIGVGRFLEHLHVLGIQHLQNDAEFYGEGLALGSGEITLLELVGAYATLARGGEYRPLRLVSDGVSGPTTRVYQEETASLISHILADPGARAREFGASGVLTFPVETAVKTGTSSDYRDGWALGFSDRYTVGVWFGNLDRSPMAELSGAAGPGLVLRAAFHELRRRDGTSAPLPLTSRLVKRRVCRITGLPAGDRCEGVDEWYAPGHVPTGKCSGEHSARGIAPIIEGNIPPGDGAVMIARPSEGLNVAADPRIPDELEQLPFELVDGSQAGGSEGGAIVWTVDGAVVGQSTEKNGKLLWKISKGTHTVTASNAAGQVSKPVSFIVR